jgi:hypothetical protein
MPYLLDALNCKLRGVTIGFIYLVVILLIFKHFARLLSSSLWADVLPKIHFMIFRFFEARNKGTHTK